MSFADHLAGLLPEDLPHRDTVVVKASRHLELIVDANRNFNLTRILDEREAAIKHVVDSLIPWLRFADAGEVIDAGTGAGFPGIPLAAVFPDVRFLLVESTGKKARFVADAAKQLELSNVSVLPQRVEDVVRGKNRSLITARAVAPLPRMLDYIGGAVRSGCRALLYKGPDAETEIEEAKPILKRNGIHARIVDRYTLPDNLGSRTLVEVAHTAPR